MRAAYFILLPTVIALDLTDPQEFVRIASAVNAAQTGWTANASLAAQRFSTLADVKTLCGTFQRGDPNWENISLPSFRASSSLQLPTSFDPREQWPKCTVIGKVRNQAGCGSCWAFGATESFEGRRCAATGQDIEFSADDTAACSKWFGNGCNGGQPSAANKWFTTTGVVTGGEYGESNGCLPYVCPPCSKGLYPPDCPTDQCNSMLKCTKTCSNAAYGKQYHEDKTKAQQVFSAGSVTDMQNALASGGPLAAAFTVYADFPTYASGVYSHTSGGALGGHAVVVLGWGSEGGRDYWLIKNSWSEKWGDHGFFKMLRGQDECGIESDVSGTMFSAAVSNTFVV